MLLSNYLRCVKKRQIRYVPLETEIAGEAGEERILQVLRRAAKRAPDTHIFPGLRLPIPEKQAFFEIDILILSPYGLIGIEVKNWGGTISRADNGKWIQKTRGNTREHSDPVLLLRRKMEALSQFLASRGQALSSEAFQSYVVFSNTRADVDHSVWDSGEFLPLWLAKRELTALIRPNRLSLQRFSRTISGSWKHKKPLIENVEKVLADIRTLPTWDALVLHGGRVIRGDIDGPQIKLRDGRTVGREQARTLCLHVPRSYTLSWLMPMQISWSLKQGQKLSHPLQPEQEIRIACYGHKEKTEAIALEHLQEIRFGWR